MATRQWHMARAGRAGGTPFITDRWAVRLICPFRAGRTIGEGKGAVARHISFWTVKQAICRRSRPDGRARAIGAVTAQKTTKRPKPQEPPLQAEGMVRLRTKLPF